MFSSNFKNTKIIKNFIIHNKKNFNKYNGNNIFLIEFNRWEGIHIAFSYLSNFFSSKKKCKILAYEAYSLFYKNNESFLSKIKWNIGKIFRIRNFGVYSSFGTQDFIKPKYSKIIRIKSTKILLNFYKKKKKLKDLENLKIENIWIGDLIYDTYLKRNLIYTIDLSSEDFKDYFFKCICNFYFWLDYFKKNKIKGVASCHGVYASAIPLRIANYKKLYSFHFSGSNIFNSSNKISYKNKCNATDTQFKFYKKKFKNLKKDEKTKGIILGKKYLDQIIKGKQKYYYLKNSSFLNKKNNFKFSKSKKIKVIIYTQLFSDSPHVYGNHFFSDFFQWFEFLKKIINQTDYDWYLKRHPQEDKITKLFVDDFLKKFSKVKNIPKHVSNLYIAKNKIDFALTMYGTIASELSAYGIKVLNASINNPHIDYDFSLNPKNLNEYKNYLLNLDKKKFKIKIKDLYEYHYMKNFYSPGNDYIFSNIYKYFKFKKKRQLFLTPRCYEIWMESFSQGKHKKVIKAFENFIYSGDYMLLPNHYKKTK